MHHHAYTSVNSFDNDAEHPEGDGCGTHSTTEAVPRMHIRFEFRVLLDFNRLQRS